MSFDKTIHLPVSVDEAFALITQPERLRRWKTVAARVDLRLGGDFRWTVAPGHHAAGTFQEIEPGKRIVFTWGWEGGGDPLPGESTVTITLEPEANGTSLRLVHDGLTEEQAAAHAIGWNHYLGRLLAETSLETGAGRDDWAWAPDPIGHLTSADASLAVLLGVLRNVTADDAGNATPCQDFNVAGLLDHLAGSLQSIGRALGADMKDRKDAAPETRIADLAQRTLEAFAHRGIEGNVDMGSSELPATTVAGILNLELLVHAWDFAAATGQQVAVSDVVSDYVTELARETISEQVRSNGSFAPARPAAETASSLERLVAFTGRSVTH